jgi:tRNA A37 threonylcarbamoyltransferase TsaD
MLAEVSERALAHCEKNELLLIGGVAANKRLVGMLQKMCDARGSRFGAAPMEFAGDQAAMIAWQGILEFKAGRKDDAETADIRPYERTDEVEVFW